MNTSDKILVTGATGYIGSHLCKTLCEKGYTVHGLDNNWKTHNDPSKYLHKAFKIDIANTYADIQDRYHTVVHLAGLISVEESTKFAARYFEVNTNSTRRLIEKTKFSNIIYASTAAAFDPVSPYALSKLMSEWIIRQNYQDYTIFRFFNVAGNSGEFGQVGESTHLIRIAAETAAGKRDSIKLYGTDYPTPDGTCVRDYIHVQDLVDTIEKAIYNPMNSQYECLGAGTGYSCREVIDTMKRVTGKDFKVVEADRRPGDTPVLIVDNPSKLLNCEKTLEDMCLSAYKMEL